MKAKEEYHKLAYSKAEEMSCNVDCARYRAGTCVAEMGHLQMCYRFNETYNYYIVALMHNDCISEHKLAHCNECIDRDDCLIAEKYEWNLL